MSETDESSTQESGTETERRGPSTDANKPIAEMTDSERADYFRNKANRLEGQLKPLGGVTPDVLSSLRERAARADALENDLATDTERAAREARKATEDELRPQLQAQAVEDAFRLLVGDRKTDDEVTDFLADLNLSRFIGENGRVDTAKVRDRAAQFAPVTGASTTTQEQQTRRGPTVTPVGPMTRSTGQPGEQGRAAAEARFGKKTQ